ncbi:hypothetical protein SDC9_109141 [bioreactor metagenome]|uniref:Uncharacterized protein n=1 Tax=bioreactor metagenome TaxID=1076179 RepID=A0A645BA15_9ZZZZ
MDVDERVISHAFAEIDGIQHLDTVAALLIQEPSALGQDTSLRVGDDVAAVHLHEVRLDEKAGFAAAAAADHQHVLIPRVLGLLWAAVHRQAFRLREQDIVFKHGVDVRLDVCRRTPSSRAVFNVLSVLLGVVAFHVHRQADKRRARDADAEVEPVETRRCIFKGGHEAVEDVQQLVGKGRACREAVCLSHLVKEVHEQQIRDVRNNQLLDVRPHSSRPLSMLLTLSRAVSMVFASCLACDKSRRTDFFCSCISFLAVNSRNACCSTSTSRPLKNTR